MNEPILIYRPYRMQTIAAYIGIVQEMILLLFLGGLLFHPEQRSMQAISVTVVLGVFMMFMIKSCFDAGKNTICFTEEGLHLINDGKTAWRFVPWENFTHTYLRNGSKCTYLVLSCEELDTTRLKKITRKAAETMIRQCMTVDNAVVITLDAVRDKENAKVSEIVKEKVSYNQKPTK